MKKLDLKSMRIDELKEEVLKLGEKQFRAEQVYQGIHQHLLGDIDSIKGLPKDFKEKLKEKYYISRLDIAKKLESKIDYTKKYLLKTTDGNIIESVFMKYKHGNSICISTQVGCRMSCAFCASTKKGLVRNLSAGEILEQYYTVKKDVGEKIGNIVLMGSGEPLDNIERVIKFMEIINSEKGQNIGYRSITLSTCGITPKIKELAGWNKPINFALSLHNPFDAEREEIMPISKKYKIREVIEACKYYQSVTKRRVTIEYVLIEGVNDSRDYAKELAKIIKGLSTHVNLIPLNTVEEYKGKKASKKNISIFEKMLKDKNINVTVRRELGSDINAACGQLRADYINDIK